MDVPAELYPYTPRTLRLDGGIRLSYLDEGTGPPVLLLHGNPSWSFLYRRLIAALRGTHRVIAPDHIGMGLSDKPPAGRYRYRLDQRVADLDRLLTTLDVGRFSLVVHDWGGMIGLAWATLHADRIDRLVLLNTAAFPLPAGKRLPLALKLARAPWVGDLLVRGANGFVRSALSLAVTRRHLERDVRRGYLAPYDSWAHRVAVQAFVRDIPVRRSDPSYATVAATAARLGALADTPTLICWGMRDPVLDPDYLAEWQRLLPAAEVHRVDAAGHYVLEEAPDVVIPLVADFLAAPAGATP